MNKHTPGPWTYTGNGHDEIVAPNVIVLEDDGGCGDPSCCGPASYWVAISSDNARLIAAAPELLEALKLCAAVCAGETINKNGLIAALESARAAIARATGEQ
jgi:hypothetical protein